MKRFLKNIILLAIPLILYLVFIAIVDPYNFLNFSRLIDDEVKRSISSDVEPHLYKLIAFENNPKRNITLGDSRTNSLYQGMDYEVWANLAYRGGTLKESIQTFWWLVDDFEVDSILLGLNLNLYNKYNKRFWVEETIETKKNFFSYAFNKFTFKSAMLITSTLFGMDEPVNDDSDLAKEEFWQAYLAEIPDKFFEKFAYPDNYYENLKEISAYCAANQIELIFWIPPTHIDFQNRIKEYNMEKQDLQFRKDLNSFGKVFDYNYPNILTTEKENFRDPLHFENDIAILIWNEISGIKSYIAKPLDSDSIP